MPGKSRRAVGMASYVVTPPGCPINEVQPVWRGQQLDGRLASPIDRDDADPNCSAGMTIDSAFFGMCPYPQDRTDRTHWTELRTVRGFTFGLILTRLISSRRRYSSFSGRQDRDLPPEQLRPPIFCVLLMPSSRTAATMLS